MDLSSPGGAGELEDSLRAAWAKILEVPAGEIADSSHFFESGGDSLLAVELVVCLSETLGVTVPLDSILADGTFGGLQAVCQELAAAR